MSAATPRVAGDVSAGTGTPGSSPPDFGRSVRHGLRWMGISVVAGRAMRFLMMIALARLLAKDAFGVVMIANAALEVPQALREVGFSQAFVQREFGDEASERRGLDTTFTIALGVNALLFLATMLGVPFLIGFFDKVDGLEPVLRVIVCGLLLDAFVVAPSALLQRRLEYGRDTRATLSGAFTLAIVSVLCAALGLGVWSLVIGQHASKLVTIGVLVRYSGWRPRLAIDREIAGHLFSFGKYMWGFSILRAAGGVLDRLLLGRTLGAGAVAVYAIAFNLCNMPATQVGYAVSRVAFPALSRLQGDLAKLRRTVATAISHVAIVVAPLGVGLLAVAADFVVVVYGERWAEAVPVVQIMAFYGMALAIASPAGPALQAIGRPGVIMAATLVRQVLLVILLVQLASMGLVGVAYAVLIPLLASACFGVFCLVWIIGCPASDVLGAILRPAAAVTGMWVSVRAANLALADLARIPRLAVAVALGAVVYVGLSFLLNRRRSLDLLATLRKTLGRGR